MNLSFLNIPSGRERVWRDRGSLGSQQGRVSAEPGFFVRKLLDLRGTRRLATIGLEEVEQDQGGILRLCCPWTAHGFPACQDDSAKWAEGV